MLRIATRILPRTCQSLQGVLGKKLSSKKSFDSFESLSSSIKLNSIENDHQRAKFKPEHFGLFEELLARDPSNSNHWVRTLKNRPDLLQICSSIDILQEVKDILVVEFEASKKKTFAVIEILPEYFFQQNCQNELRLTLSQWQAFCHKRKLQSFEILLEIPLVLAMKIEDLEIRDNQLRDYFANVNQVSDLIKNNPQVLFDYWPSLKAKLEFIIYDMKVLPRTLAKSKVLSYDLTHIKDRYDFLLRAGLYQHPTLKSKTNEPAEAYPKISDIVETDLPTFIDQVAGNGFTPDDFTLFVNMLNSELDDEHESLEFLQQGYTEDESENVENRK